MPSTAQPHYDLAILGTGSGNSIPSEAMEDWRIAIIEPDVFGGTCLNRGCIPSKMFVHHPNGRPVRGARDLRGSRLAGHP